MYSIGNPAGPHPGSMGASPDSASAAVVQASRDDMAVAFQSVTRPVRDGTSPQLDAVTMDKKTAASAAVDFECIEPVDTENEPATIVQRTR